MVSSKISEPDLVRLDNQLCFMLYACSRAMTRAYQPLLKEMGLTYPQYLVLMVLWQWHDECVGDSTVSALGERLHLDSGTLTPLLKRLEKNGLINRLRDSSDERRVLVSVTEQGLTLKRVAEKYLLDRSGSLGEVDVPQLRAELKKLLHTLQSLEA